MKEISVLFIEDSPLDAELLIRHIKKSKFELTYNVTDSLKEVELLIAKQQYDLVICDYKLPGFSGLEAIKRIKELGEDIPVILASGTIPDEQAVDAILAGAKDYVLKDNLKRLIPAIHREISALEERRERRKSDLLLDAVFNSSMGVRVSNRNRIIVKVNNAYCEMMGYEEEELIGLSIDHLIPKERRDQDRKEYEQFIKDYLEKGVDNTDSKRDIRKDGTSIDVLVRSNVFVENNEVFVVSTLQNVSEVFKYKTLFEESGRIAKLGGWERDLVTGKEVWTKQIYEIYEVTEDTFDPATESDDRFHTKESLFLMKKSMKAAVEKGIPFDIEVEIVDAKGNKKWCRGTGNPVIEDSKVVKLIGSFQDITERKARELERKRNEEKYKFLFDHSPNPMLIFEIKSDKIVDTNLAAEKLYGYSKEEFKALKAEDLRPVDKVEKYHEIRKKRDSNLNSKEIRSFYSVSHQKKSGASFMVDIYSRTTNINGSLSNIVIVNDITEKYNYEQDLLKANSLLEALISNSPIGLVTVNHDGKIEELWNPKAEEIFGWKRENVLGKQLPYVQQSKFNEFQKNLKLGFEGKQSFITEIERVKKNGETVYLKEFVTPLFDDEGNVQKLMLLIEDITEKKKVEYALVGSEQKYRNLVEASHDLVWRIDPDGNFNFINNASESILGYAPVELIGKPFMPYINPSKAGDTIEIHKNVLDGDVYESFPLEMVNSDGELRHLSATAYPIIDDSGEIVGCSGTATDITHIKTYQSQLEDSLAEKEILIKEIHHRVKNNLAVISGLFELQSMHVEDVETLTILQESQSRIKSIATIHEKLYQNHVFSSIEIKNYLEDIILDIADTYQRYGKEIEINIDGDEISLNVNQAVPFGILANELIINAYKYAFKKQVKGEITLMLESIDNTLKFSVKDNGIGLPEDFDIDKLTSLGMTLVRTLASQLEAKFDWNSKPSEGTIFTVTFTPSVVTKSTWVQKKPDKFEPTRPRKNVRD